MTLDTTLAKDKHSLCCVWHLGPLCAQSSLCNTLPSLFDCVGGVLALTVLTTDWPVENVEIYSTWVPFQELDVLKQAWGLIIACMLIMCTLQWSSLTNTRDHHLGQKYTTQWFYLIRTAVKWWYTFLDPACHLMMMMMSYHLADFCC